MNLSRILNCSKQTFLRPVGYAQGASNLTLTNESLYD